MATLKAVVRKQRKDGFYPVYIRIGHKTQKGYIKTNKLIAPESLNSKGEITDDYVNEYCKNLILRYNDRLNRKDISTFSALEVVEYLTEDSRSVCFSDYAREHINRMINSGHERTSKNYKLAVAHLERFLGTTNVKFDMLSSAVLRKWIVSLDNTCRAKEMYPVCIRQIFKSALLELNDEERGVVRIKFNPWLKVKIPKGDRGPQRAISAEACREFFNRPLPQSKMISPLPEFGRDVAMLILCLGGINTVDLYNLRKSDYHGGKICYKRAKTRHSRRDEAYFEMRVEPFIRPVFEKYLSGPDDEYLFMFRQRYCDSDSFCANVNNGIKKICADMGMAKEDYYCAYTFRHTWGTIAQNDCDANIADVAFGMNHTHGFRVTRGYVKLDFTPAWTLNAKVIDFIFYSDKPSKQGLAKSVEDTHDLYFRITAKMMIYARAYFKGKMVAELTDIGFGNVDAVIDALVPKLPKDIPTGCTVQFRLTNCDSQKEMVYERTKGKGF
ncbi:MAG: phage integrase SAM-like domain-containing protein [Muribaculaceae bacterium]|nr:phage integrase SAM-like domain-containing protein [Muribaculaceae bacterium]